MGFFISMNQRVKKKHDGHIDSPVRFLLDFTPPPTPPSRKRVILKENNLEFLILWAAGKIHHVPWMSCSIIKSSPTMVLILDGNSFPVAHASRKKIFSDKYIRFVPALELIERLIQVK